MFNITTIIIVTKLFVKQLKCVISETPAVFMVEVDTPQHWLSELLASLFNAGATAAAAVHCMAALLTNRLAYLSFQFSKTQNPTHQLSDWLLLISFPQLFNRSRVQ
jgi:hypothetical protein